MTAHKSDCATNNAPAMVPADCTCDPVLHIITLGEKSRYKQFHSYNAMTTSWQANLLIETVKSFCGFWPTDNFTPDHRQTVRMPTTEEVMERATSLVDATIAELNRRQWVVRVPSPDELREQDEANVGFMPRGT